MYICSTHFNSIHYTHSKGTICAKVSNLHLGYCTKIVIDVLRLLTEEAVKQLQEIGKSQQSPSSWNLKLGYIIITYCVLINRYQAGESVEDSKKLQDGQKFYL